MNVAREDLARLVALQERDLSLDKIKAEMDSIPAAVADLRAEAARVKESSAAAKTAYLNLEKQKKEKEAELAQKEEAVKKHSVELNQVKSNDAFKALKDEIDRAKSDAGDIETAILEIMDSIDRAKADEKKAAAQAAEAEKKISSQIAELESRLAALKAEHEAGQAGRGEAAAAVSPSLLGTYDHIRSRGKLDAVVTIDGAHCAACRMVQAPHIIVEATRSSTLVQCESCQRILYLPAPAAKAA